MGLLDSSGEEPQSKIRRYLLTFIIFGLLMAAGAWWIFRFYSEKKIVGQFMDALVANDTKKAYELWKPSPSYSYQDFLEDWGAGGYYGPVKSYRFETAQRKAGASGVIVVVALSPYEVFPSQEDSAKFRKIKEVRIWVESRDLSMSFAP